MRHPQFASSAALEVESAVANVDDGHCWLVERFARHLAWPVDVASMSDPLDMNDLQLVVN